MRPNQNNKNRSRGRNNNGGRKHVNPLSRNFESNGPDVKVRGNAAHIAEKYLQLARDAQSSGDSVMAENYLQHAEHYFRIVASAQPQQNPRDQAQQAEDDYDDDFPPMNDRFASPEPRQPFPQPSQQSEQPAQPGSGQESEAAESSAQPAAAEADSQAAQGEGEGGRRRERRPRRRSRGNGEGGPGEGGADPGNAPQPSVDLPAFLTVGSTTAAE